LQAHVHGLLSLLGNLALDACWATWSHDLLQFEDGIAATVLAISAKSKGGKIKSAVS